MICKWDLGIMSHVVHLRRTPEFNGIVNIVNISHELPLYVSQADPAGEKCEEQVTHKREQNGAQALALIDAFLDADCSCRCLNCTVGGRHQRSKDQEGPTCGLFCAFPSTLCTFVAGSDCGGSIWVWQKICPHACADATVDGGGNAWLEGLAIPRPHHGEWNRHWRVHA